MQLEVFYFILLRSIKAQVESGMGMPQSNLDLPAYQPALVPCPREWQWACRNGECIARYDTCDGIPQCSDGSDEQGCDTWGMRPKEGAGARFEGATGKALLTPTATVPTTTSAITTSGRYVVLSVPQIFFALVVLGVLVALVVTIVRRRGRKRALMRNRRGHILQQDSDEDDILISSMYS